MSEPTPKPVSRQRAWQLRMKASGRCILCGKPRGNCWDRCDPCQAKVTAAVRKRTGCQPWQPGKPGRPPACHSIKNPVQKAA
jgi:hypothetical protein